MIEFFIGEKIWESEAIENNVFINLK